MINGNRKILVIDAEPVVRSVVKDILSRKQYAVSATDDVSRAIEICTNERQDLIITNVFLRGITGHDAMRLLKEKCPGVPVLMVSGLPDSRAIRDWIAEDGFDAFPKPFRAEDLVQKVEEILAERKRLGAN